MKKIFMLFAAAMAAITLSATELTLDLSTAQQYVQTGSADVTVTGSELDVHWNVTAGWSVAGAAFDLDDLTDVSAISFDYKGATADVDMIVCLEDAAGNKLWDVTTGGLSLSQADWTSVELTPNAALWSNDSEGPWTKLVFMANPATPTEGHFFLRNVKITYTGEEVAEEWSEIAFTAPVAAADLDAAAEFAVDGFKMAITDPDNKMSVDANSCRFGSATDYTMYTHRLKTGGKSSASKNFMTLTIPEAGTLRLAVRTGSNSDTTRTLIAVQGADTLYNEIIQESVAVKVTEGEAEVSVYPYVEIPVETGNVSLTYPINGLNFYLFAFKAGQGDVPPVEPETIPTTAPAAPTHDEADVMAIYCNHYTTNNANFAISGWAGAYQTLDLAGTNVGYWSGMTWECIIDPANTDAAHDYSAYEYLHIDMWAPEAAKIKFVAEAVASGNYKDGHLVDLAQGWNSFDFAIAEWTGNYDFTNLKCFVFEQYQTPENASFEGNPFAFANIYFWKTPGEPMPQDTIALDFSNGGGYVDNTYFAEYGTTDLVLYNIPVVGEELIGDGEYLVLDLYPEDPNDISGTYTLADETLDDYYSYMIVVNGTDTTEVAFTNGEVVINVQQLYVDYSAAQIAVAALLTGDDGNIYTVSGVYTLYYDFIPLGVENIEKDEVQCTKRILNGELIIEKNGKTYNVVGAEVK